MNNNVIDNNVQLNDMDAGVYDYAENYGKAQQASGHFEATDDNCYENNVYDYADLTEGNQGKTRQVAGHFGANDDNIDSDVYDYADFNDDKQGKTQHAGADDDDSRYGINVKPGKMRGISSKNKLNDIDPDAYDYVGCNDDNYKAPQQTGHFDDDCYEETVIGGDIDYETVS